MDQPSVVSSSVMCTASACHKRAVWYNPHSLLVTAHISFCHHSAVFLYVTDRYRAL